MSTGEGGVEVIKKLLEAERVKKLARFNLASSIRFDIC